MTWPGVMRCRYRSATGRCLSKSLTTCAPPQIWNRCSSAGFARVTSARAASNTPVSGTPDGSIFVATIQLSGQRLTREVSNRDSSLLICPNSHLCSSLLASTA